MIPRFARDERKRELGMTGDKDDRRKAASWRRGLLTGARSNKNGEPAASALAQKPHRYRKFPKA